MKINQFLGKFPLSFLFACSVMLCFAQCNRTPEETFKLKGGLRVLVGLDESSPKSTDESVEMRNQVMTVLQNRIEYYGITPHIKWLDDKDCILLEIPGVKDKDRVLGLLQHNGNLEFWETYELANIFDSLVNADERLAQLLTPEKNEDTNKPKKISLTDKDQNSEQPKDDMEALLESIESNDSGDIIVFKEDYEENHPLFSKLQISMYQGSSLIPGPVIGYANTDDKEQITQYLNMKELKSVLPSACIFKWSVKPIDEDGTFYELYALKEIRRQGAVLDGSVITEAKVDSDNQNGYSISLQMNDEGARMWARVTRENIGNSIAMVVDDKVYSAPRVMSEIEGGRSMISGNFTKEEAKDLANMLNAGRMPVPLKIIHSEIVSPDSE